MKLARTFFILLSLLLATNIAAPVCQGQVLQLIELANSARRGGLPYYQKGNYQLTDGTWQQGNWMVDDDKLRVIDPKNKKEGPRDFSVAEVQQAVAGEDTFRIVRNFDVLNPTDHIDGGFAQQIYRGGDFLLVRYVYLRSNKVAKVYKLLVRGSEAPAIVPEKPREFRKFMLAYVSDQPLLAKQLATNVLTPEHAVPILRNYVTWKKYQQKSTAPASE